MTSSLATGVKTFEKTFDLALAAFGACADVAVPISSEAKARRVAAGADACRARRTGLASGLNFELLISVLLVERWMRIP